MIGAVKVALGFCLAVGLLLLGAIWIVSGASMPAIAPPRTTAPAGFDAADYPDLSAVRSTEQAHVINVGRYGDPFEILFLQDLSITMFILFTDSGQERELFIDSDGALMGELTEQGPIRPTEPFMVMPDGYYEVTADGISGRQPMQVLGSVTEAALLRMIEESTQYLSFAPSDLPEDDPDREAGRTIHVMQHGGVWKRIASARPYFFEWKTSGFGEMDAVYRISRARPSADRENFFNSRYRVELTHFDQEEFRPSRSAPMGSTTGVGQSAHWIGTGYYTVFVDNLPALRFRIENDREYVSDSGPVHLVVKGSSELDFIAITHTGNDNLKEAIVVSGR